MAAPVRINLGAGLQEAPGWINYDRSRSALLSKAPGIRSLARVAGSFGLLSNTEMLVWPEATRTADLRKGIPHGDETVDIVYSSHMFEHLTRAEVDALLRECWRVLKPEGVIRIVVPDVRLAAERFLSGDREFFGEHSDVPMSDAFVEYLHLRPQPKGQSVGAVAPPVRPAIR